MNKVEQTQKEYQEEGELTYLEVEKKYGINRWRLDRLKNANKVKWRKQEGKNFVYFEDNETLKSFRPKL